jgi:hypothetical protein
MITFWDIIVVAGILGFAFWGWREGLEAAGVAALELLACLALGITLHETVAGWLHAGAVLLVGDWASQAWCVLLAFGLLVWGGFALIRFQFHAAAGAEEPEEAEIDPLADRLGGVVAGGFGGMLFIGGVFVTLSMVPFLAGLKPAENSLLDVGKTALRVAGQFAGGWHEGRSLPLWGEPPSRRTVLSARLTSEPWFDTDDDGKLTEADRYRDVDGSGTFTKDLFFEDSDGDGLRRIGLIDKYVVGRWDAMLISEDRPRPKPDKPAAPTPPAPAKPGPAKPGPAGKPPASGPAQPTKPAPKSSQPETPEKPGTGEAETKDTPTERLPEDDF